MLRANFFSLLRSIGYVSFSFCKWLATAVAHYLACAATGFGIVGVGREASSSLLNDTIISWASNFPAWVFFTINENLCMLRNFCMIVCCKDHTTKP